MPRKKTDSGSLSRCEFLGTTAVVALSPGSLLKTAGRQDAFQSLPWYSLMRRCGQINYNERDPLTVDPDAWMDYWASLKVDAVLLNGGGILAFYPTQVPFHHRSQFLGSRDLFGEMVAAAKKRGLRVGLEWRAPLPVSSACLSFSVHHDPGFGNIHLSLRWLTRSL